MPSRSKLLSTGGLVCSMHNTPSANLQTPGVCCNVKPMPYALTCRHLQLWTCALLHAVICLCMYNVNVCLEARSSITHAVAPASFCISGSLGEGLTWTSLGTHRQQIAANNLHTTCMCYAVVCGQGGSTVAGESMLTSASACPGGRLRPPMSDAIMSPASSSASL